MLSAFHIIICIKSPTFMLKVAVSLRPEFIHCTYAPNWDIEARGPVIQGSFHQWKEMSTRRWFTYSFSFSLCTCQHFLTEFIRSWGQVCFMSCLRLYHVSLGLGHLLGLGLGFSRDTSREYPVPIKIVYFRSQAQVFAWAGFPWTT